MKVSSLKGVVTIEMERELAMQLTITLKNQVDDMLQNPQKFRRTGYWIDLATLGQVRDCLDEHLFPALEE